jgi:hypothetical protein
MNCLTESIKEKWIPVRDGKHPESGPADCPCCEIYYSNPLSTPLNCCVGCPIKAYTGRLFCTGTPYHEFVSLQDKFLHEDIYELHAECTAAAQMEIDFLNKVRESRK